ncbi:MAG: DegT/DnrJ/EryC1/StrS family aminotransferase [Rhodocyclaceae bacterium]|nr:DegT/DnrJ/EryC1/StrS family aminotransferase [Rhodocyclaceae bacterium]
MSIRETYLPFGAPNYSEAEIEAVTRIMRSGWLGLGQETLSFEAELAAALGVDEIVAVNSCTSALFLALRESGVRSGDDVIVPSLTWCSSANVALYLDARPVFCDVDSDTFSMSVETVLASLTSRTRAVVVVHYGGLAVDVQALRRALPERVAIIEDAAHALGARYPDGSVVGSSGNLTCFSFYANKNLATGEGGAIALGDPTLANRLRSLRMHGMDSSAWSRYVKPSTIGPGVIAELGFKMNYSDLQAAIGRVQLQRFPEMQAHRQALAERYQQRLQAELPWLKMQEGCFTPMHAKHLLVGRFDPEKTGMQRDDLLKALRLRNVGASIHYAPLHNMPLYAEYKPPVLPVTERLAPQILTLPIGAKLEVADVDYVCEQLLEILKEVR